MPDHKVAIIGAGFSGMGLGIALDRAGISDFVLLEKSDDIGGTWRDNQYPGACCDVPSPLYSFSFEPNPHWSHRFSRAQEIHAYQRSVIDRYRLRERIYLGFEVATATFSDGGWNLLGKCGRQMRVQFLVCAIGTLHIPNKPAFAGLDQFNGKVMHSAEWDHDYDYANRNIIVIGSAASAVQIIPKLAACARRVHVMQRTPNHILPRKDRTITRLEKACFRHFPFTQRLVRWRQYCVNDFLFHRNFTNRPGLIRKLLRHKINQHLRRQVQDPLLRKRLTPAYQPGCKRILLSDDYLPALQQDNVALVTTHIDHFTESGLVTAEGASIDADLVVLATGFKTDKLHGDVTITGPDGLTLEQAWNREIRAHRSVAVTSFPNFFMMYGPNSNLGHNSIILMIEAQASYIARILQHAEHNAKPTVVVRADKEQDYNEAIQAALKNTVWNTACESWYKNEQGKIFSLWPHSTTRFAREMRRAPMDEYLFE